MNILQKIFTDYYEEIKYTLHPRDTEMENIDKMINCGDPAFGGAMYICTHCGKFKFVPFRCHSRFCPTCGNKYAIGENFCKQFLYCSLAHTLGFLIYEKIGPVLCFVHWNRSINTRIFLHQFPLDCLLKTAPQKFMDVPDRAGRYILIHSFSNHRIDHCWGF